MSQRPCPAENEDYSWPGVPDWMTWTVNPLSQAGWTGVHAWGSTQKLMRSQ